MKVINFKKCKRPKKLSQKQIKDLLHLSKFIVFQKPNNKISTLRYLDNKSIDDISESIYNLLFNEKLNLVLSNSQKAKLKRIIKPSIQNYEIISKKTPLNKRKTKIIQNGAGIGTILFTLIPILTSLLTKK